MRTKNILILVLVVILLMTTLASCNSTPEESTQPSQVTSSSPDAPSSPTTPPAPDDDIVLSNVTLTAGNSGAENLALAELAWYLSQKEITVAEGGYPITLSIDPTLAVDGYKIEAAESGLTIQGGTNRGLIYGIYAFLEKFAGVHFYAADTVVIDNTDVVISLGVLDEFVPVFQILRNPWAPIEALAEKNGGNKTQSRDRKTLTLEAIAGNDGTEPLCPTNPESIAAAIQAVTETLTANPDITSITLTTNSESFCQCADCTALHEQDESPAGAYIGLVNAIVEAVVPAYPNLSFAIDAVSYLQTAPKVTKPAAGMTVYISTLDCHATHPLSDENCPSSVAFVQNLNNWVNICNHVSLEYVVTSVTDYIPTFANFGALRENMHLFAECGVKSISCSGNFANPSGEFAELRAYLLSKLLVDPLMSEEEYYAHMDAFLQAFYGEGWHFIREIINHTTRVALNGGYIIDENGNSTEQAVCGQSATDHPLTVITKREYMNLELLFDECFALAEELASNNADHVKHAAYQWRYIKLCLYPNAEDAQAFINDIASFRAKIEWADKLWNIDTENSDLSLAPTEWVYKS